MAAHPGPGEHAEEAVRLGARGHRDLDRVQAERAARVGELVGQGQGYSPEDVLVELGCLGGVGRADQVDRVGEPADDLGGPAGTGLSGPADDPRGLALQVVRVAWVDPLRAEGHVDVGACGQPPLPQRPGEQITGGTDVAGGGQDDHLAGHGVPHHVRAGGAQGGQVRGLLRVHRGRYADDDRLGGGRRGRVGGQLERAVRQGRGEALLVGFGKVRGAGGDIPQPLLADVNADNPRALAVQFHRGRQADVPQADNGHRPRGNRVI